MRSVTNDSSVPTCFSQGLVIKQLSACQVHERTSPQIGEHITVFTSVCLSKICKVGEIQLGCFVFGLGRSWPGHQTSKLFADEKDHLVRAHSELCGL